MSEKEVIINAATTAAEEVAKNPYVKDGVSAFLGFAAGVGGTILIPKAVKGIKNKISGAKEKKAKKKEAETAAE